MESRACPFEIKELSQAGVIVGLAAAFGNIDAGGDRIAKGAFAKSLAEHASAGTRPAMLLHHDLARPIGAWSKFTETADGLVAEGKITLDAQDGREAYALARDGALTGLSIGYQIDKQRYGASARELLAVELFEVSLVSVPMNNRARIQSIKMISGVRDIEELLKSGGLSNRQAKSAASAAWRAINNSEDDEAAQAVLAGAIERLAQL